MQQTKKSLMQWGVEVDIKEELYRVYDFNGYFVKINNPKMLIVSDNGHRIVDKLNISHYIPYGWVHLYWENIDKAKFQFNYQRKPRRPS